MTRQFALRLALIAVFMAAVAVFFLLDLDRYFSLATLQAQRDNLLAFTEQNQFLVLALFMGVYILMAALSVPGAAVLTLTGGAL
ncbi:MAG TPA: pyridine nucleotide-disulfide oxidoreductase, partial [Wenzhouxiangella sp.]|nr:pyridine nucleotide-disulfide oxidoreductase [Wenzhouxiangella sp.]